jgi:hypothetical protein
MTDKSQSRYAIMRGEWSVTKTDDDTGESNPYGIEIDYYDRDTKHQGTVKMMVHQLPSSILEEVTAGLAAAVEYALTVTSPHSANYQAVQEVGDPYPEEVLSRDNA